MCLGSQKLLFFSISILSCIFVTQGCAFNSFEDSLLSLHKPIEFVESNNFDINSSETSFSFGFWSIFIPQQQFSFQPFFDKDYDNSIYEDGQIFFALKATQQIKVIGFLMIDAYQQTLQHYFIYFYDDFDFDYILFDFTQSDYEGLWIFTLITIEKIKNTIIVETTGKEKQEFSFEIDKKNLQIIVGGRSYIKNLFNLNIFKGRLSKLILFPFILYYESMFSEQSLNCKIPSPYEVEQKIDLIPGLKYFDGNTIIQTSFNEIGNRYYIQAWVKYDFSKITKPSTFRLLRISMRKQYDYFEISGDQQLIITANINKQIPLASNILIQREFHNFPIFGQMNFNNLQTEPIVDFSESIFQGLSQWHLLKYEYGIQSLDYTSIIQIQFYNNAGLKEIQFQGNQFINSIFYIFIGGDDYLSNLLQAYIFDFQFFFNYDQNKDLSIQACHYSCLTCDGPLDNNCLSCNFESNRVYLVEAKKCQCQLGFLDQGTLFCLQFQDYFQSLKYEIISSKQQSVNNCKFGSFRFPKYQNIICLECPYIEKTNFQCLDCLLNPDNWYIRPICTKDLEQTGGSNDSAYNENLRTRQNYDLYFIDEAGLMSLQHGLEDFCEYSLIHQSCFKASNKHLGDYPQVFCKQNYYQMNNECIYSNPYCLEVDQFGICQKYLNGMYQQNGQFYQCPIQCPGCYFDISSQSIQCTECLEKYSLVNGQCIQCGQNCKICQYYTDDIILDNYLKCYKCTNDSKFFISFDGINCEENTIQNCLYAFQADVNNIQINTLDYQFPRRFDTENIILHCARCIDAYIYIFTSRICVAGVFVSCNFGYSQELCQIPVDDEFQNQVMVYDYYDYNGQKLQYCFINDELICTTEQICLVSDYKVDVTVQFSTECVTYSQDCAICIANKKSYYLNRIFTCLLCDTGFYSERLSGKCQKCPNDLNCYQCIQQSFLEQDQWKVDIRAFYFQFIEGHNIHPFSIYGQSSNESDYEIICSMCIDGYELYGNKCIKSCSSTCQECKIIDGENICYKCKLNQIGRQLSLSNNSCIECPYFCSLCIIRSQNDIQSINPLFQSNLYYSNSYQCLYSFQDKQYYFDEELSTFIDCLDKIECYQRFTIHLNLFCSKEDYQEQYQTLIKDEDKMSFLQNNIYIDDLVSGNSFKEFENDNFYYISNQKQIKNIIIEITTAFEQTCIIDNDGIIEQQFSINIFSAINISLILNFEHPVIFKYSKTLVFHNFRVIQIQGLHLIPIINDQFKEIRFQSQFKQQIKLQNITYYSDGSKQDNSKIQFFNIDSLEVNNFFISELIMTNPQILFFVNQTDWIKTIKFSNLQILNGLFENINLFFFSIDQQDSVEFKNIIIQSQFINSTFLNTSGMQNQGSLIINNLQLTSTKCYSSSLFYLVQFQEIYFFEILIEQSTFQSSIMFQLNSNAIIDNVIISFCQLAQSSIIITNSELIFNNQLQYLFKNLKIVSNEFNQSSQFLSMQKYSSLQSTLLIQNLLLLNNFDYQPQSQDGFTDTQTSLIFLELNIIEIDKLQIKRGYGKIDLTILYPTELILSEVSITQEESFRFLGLHQYLDCQLQSNIGQYYLQSIHIQGALNFIMTDLIIENITTYNKPIIEYFSADKIFQSQIERMILKNLHIQNNLLILTQSNSPLSILMIVSEQIIFIEFQNLTFKTNILHEYAQDQLLQSSTLLFFDCYLGNVEITNSTFIQNSVFNSSDTIIQITSNQLKISNCLFDQNNQFNYQIFQKHLLWGFAESETVYIEDLESIFPILSKSGNAFLVVQYLTIQNCTFSNSQGQTGGGVQIVTQKQSQVELDNIYLQNLSNQFQSQYEYGGGFYVDGKQSETQDIIFSNIIAKSLFSRYQGGFVYLTSTGTANISFVNISVQNIYSGSGSIAFLQFSSLINKKQSLFFKSLSVINNFTGLIQFYDKFFQKQFSLQEQSQIQNNMSLFYIENADYVQFEQTKIDKLLFQSIFEITNFKTVLILQLQITNFNFRNNLITLTPNLYIPTVINMKNVQIMLQSQENFQNQLNCGNINTAQFNAFFKCLKFNGTTQSPLKLQSRQQNYNFNFGQCFMLAQFNSSFSPNSLIYLAQLTEYTKTKLQSISFKNITCPICENGLIFYQFFQSGQLKKHFLSHLTFQTSICGKSSCLNLIKPEPHSRQLQTYDRSIVEFDTEMKINHFVCQNNLGYYGTCALIKNIRTQILNSYFDQNQAISKGGALFVSNSYGFTIVNSSIINNFGQIGGGIYLEDSSSFDFQQLNVQIQNNSATQFAAQIYSIPQKLVISFGDENEYLKTIVIQQNLNVKIDQTIVDIHSQINGDISQDLFLPSGISLKKYYQFNWQTNKYIKYGKKFRILALNYQNEIIKNLTGSYCLVRSREHNLTSVEEDNIFVNTFSDQQKVEFSTNTQDYNLDDMIMYMNTQLPSQLVIQFEFQCTSIYIPIYDKNYQYIIQKYHQNYRLRVNIRGLPCQFGEIVNTTSNSCITCDESLGQYTLQLNQQKCQIKDDFSTIGVTSAQLNLKAKFWRPFFNSPEVSYCLNLAENCLGGWIFGDDSCFYGHIGALCEQCDLYNVRGDGNFATTKSYTCGPCTNQKENIILIFFVSLWTLCLIVISVQSNVKVIQECIRTVNISLLGIASIYQTNKSSILIKILTNYFQIIGFLSTFQLSFPVQILQLINTTGSPIQTMIYSLDCFVSNFFNLQIQYVRIIWQLYLPIIYTFTIFIVYSLMVKLKLLDFNKSVITTTLIYMYIYLQPGLIGGLVELLSYREISNYKWLLANVAYRYDTDLHLQWMLKFILPVLFFIALMIPLLLFYALFSNSSKLKEKDVRLKWGYLYFEYKQQAYFWEILKIIYKELMIIFLIYYDDNIILKSTIITIILVIYIELSLKFQPYGIEKLNILDRQQIVVCIKSMILAAGIFIAKQNNIQEILFIYSMLLIFINAYFVIKLIIYILQEYFQEFFSKHEILFDKIKDFLREHVVFFRRNPCFRKFLNNNIKQRTRIKYLYSQLRKFLLPQAKEILIFKKNQWHLATEQHFYRDEVYESIPLSLRTHGFQEKQKSSARESNRMRIKMLGYPSCISEDLQIDVRKSFGLAGSGVQFDLQEHQTPISRPQEK